MIDSRWEVVVAAAAFFALLAKQGILPDTCGRGNLQDREGVKE